MCLVKSVSLGELYGTENFAVDKVTREMYAVIDGAAKAIDLQANIEEEMDKLEEAVGFTPKDIESSGKTHSQGSKPLELSTIDEQMEVSSIVTHRDFRENRKKFKETTSISSAGETPQEITKEEVDRAYKRKNDCVQRLTMIYRNQEIDKEMA